MVEQVVSQRIPDGIIWVSGGPEVEGELPPGGMLAVTCIDPGAIARSAADSGSSVFQPEGLGRFGAVHIRGFLGGGDSMVTQGQLT